LILKKGKNNFIKFYYEFPIEAIIWIVGLGLLAIYNPVDNQHMSFCFFAQLGIKFCPGCGLGRSVSLLLDGEIVRSFQVHPLGIFAFLTLTHRIYYLIKKYLKSAIINTNYHG